MPKEDVVNSWKRDVASETEKNPFSAMYERRMLFLKKRRSRISVVKSTADVRKLAVGEFFTSFKFSLTRKNLITSSSAFISSGSGPYSASNRGKCA